jgi:hypothetical protein
LDTHSLEEDDDRDIFAEDIMLYVNSILFQKNVTLGFSFVGGAESRRIVS